MTATRERGSLSLRPAYLLTAGRMLAFIPTFCIPMVLSRRLTPEHFGTYKQAFLVYNTLYAIQKMWHLGCLANTCGLGNGNAYMNLFTNG